MICYLSNPQLPDNDVLTVAMGACYCPEFSTCLERLGVEVLALNAVSTLDPRLRGHADLLLLHLGDDRFLAAEGIEEHNKFAIIDYVNLLNCDAALNCCLFGRKWIGNTQYSAWQPSDAYMIHVKQRYTRCSVCIVDEQSIITADHGIALAAAAGGLDVLEIRPGYIELDGFNYGFIGGASFKIARDKLAFTGSLKTHPDELRILDFLHQREIEPVYLKNSQLCDIGSVVLVCQKSF